MFGSPYFGSLFWASPYYRAESASAPPPPPPTIERNGGGGAMLSLRPQRDLPVKFNAREEQEIQDLITILIASGIFDQ